MYKEDTPVIQDFLSFLDKSPTAWHAVANVKEKLLQNGFNELFEEEDWQLSLGGRYFVSRNGSSLCAFIIPEKNPQKIKLVASHTDSPAFKLKPNAEYKRGSMVMLGGEIYGSPLLSSWLNRDLGIAGRVIYRDGENKIMESLVRLDRHPVMIPQLAIHLDRNVNESGLVLNKQEHFSALASTESPSFLEEELKTQVDYQNLLGFDLFLFPIEPAALIGPKGEMVAAYRIDSLASVHAALEGLLNARQASDDAVKMIAFWDHEEVGSETAYGAGSPFVPQVIERMILSLNLTREKYLQLLRRSLCVSVDLAHALHPNYMERHEPRHQVFLNQGIVIKHNAQQRYASDAVSSGKIVDLCQQHHISFQYFVSRNDMPCGTTIGPIHARLTGMPTVDIGIAQLSMHSSRELAGCADHLSMCHLLAHFLESV